MFMRRKHVRFFGSVMRKKIMYTIPASARFIGSCPVPKSPKCEKRLTAIHPSLAKAMMRTGFEPAHLTVLAPKASSLDHSDTASTQKGMREPAGQWYINKRYFGRRRAHTCVSTPPDKVLHHCPLSVVVMTHPPAPALALCRTQKRFRHNSRSQKNLWSRPPRPTLRVGPHFLF